MRRSVTWTGPGCVLRIPSFVASRGLKRVLIVAGNNSFVDSGAVRIMNEFHSGVEVRTWHDFSPNPKYSDLLKGLSLVRDFQPDLICGIGGGTAMDLAKLLGLFGNTAGEIREMIDGSSALPSSAIQIILAPTTAGSGSEATHFAVVYMDDTKYSVEHELMYASHILLDPSLVISNNVRNRATSGLDAICQSIESLWAVKNTSTSSVIAQKSLELLLPNIRTFVFEGTPQSASMVQLGSHLSGQAIDVTRTTAPHALSYYLTSKYGIPHGFAVAATLGNFMSAHFDHSLKEPIDWRLKESMTRVLDSLSASDSGSAVASFNSLVMDLQNASAESGRYSMPPVNIDEWADSINLDRMKNNPVQFEKDDLRTILSRSLLLA